MNEDPIPALVDTIHDLLRMQLDLAAKHEALFRAFLTHSKDHELSLAMLKSYDAFFREEREKALLRLENRAPSLAAILALTPDEERARREQAP